ncbi:hypothetical protein KZC50_15200 [Microbacterium kitamiense]|uniref:LacI family transcriptional regulator n=1 Tax=Microbacterium aurantiacum TaxID=162393 RepID=A0AAJ2M005_9MICO|nr:hypothetical protein [Microbacterium aurantiacum]MDS0246943.1 hypothetical protein [Microbacterium aurantiacum]
MRAALADGVAAETVVLGVSDVVTIGAMTAIRAASRAVDADIAATGSEDIPTSRDVSPPLTVCVPLQEVGYQTLQALVDPASEQDPDALRINVRLRDNTTRQEPAA